MITVIIYLSSLVMWVLFISTLKWGISTTGPKIWQTTKFGNEVLNWFHIYHGINKEFTKWPCCPSSNQGLLNFTTLLHTELHEIFPEPQVWFQLSPSVSWMVRNILISPSPTTTHDCCSYKRQFLTFESLTHITPIWFMMNVSKEVNISKTTPTGKDTV